MPVDITEEQQLINGINSQADGVLQALMERYRKLMKKNKISKIVFEEQDRIIFEANSVFKYFKILDYKPDKNDFFKITCVNNEIEEDIREFTAESVERWDIHRLLIVIAGYLDE